MELGTAGLAWHGLLLRGDRSIKTIGAYRTHDDSISTTPTGETIPGYRSAHPDYARFSATYQLWCFAAVQPAIKKFSCSLFVRSAL